MNRIIGHETEKELLAGLFRSGRLPSGLLFYGRKNIGKRLTAVTFASSVLCGEYRQEAQLENIYSCGECPACRSVANGTSQNLLLVEPSGNSIKMESVHKIISFLGLTPSLGGHRFIIIDDADLLNQSAANALLKTLEEPPEKSVFILVTSSPGMLPPTVLSRCLPIGFKPIDAKLLFNVFSEKFPEIGEETLNFYSRLAGGSYSALNDLIQGEYLEKRNFILKRVVAELSAIYRIILSGDPAGLDASGANAYDMADMFSAAGKTSPKKTAAVNDPEFMESLLSLLRDMYIYNMTKDTELLYNIDVVGQIESFADNFGTGGQDALLKMMDYVSSYMEKAASYNFNKTISADRFFSAMLHVKGRTPGDL